MTIVNVDIVPFEATHQTEVDALMFMISKEFTETIFSPQSKTMKEVSLLPTDKYWVALANNTVVGTIGFTILKNNTIALKRMFLSKEYRGKGISKKLLDTVIDFSDNHKIFCIYLGTMNQFKAAQKFYEKHGFKEVSQATLPIDFAINPVDTIFYKKELMKL